MLRLTICGNCNFTDVRESETECPLCEEGVMR
jgi:rubrerythrin